jgi:hypothetical protein
MAAPSEKLAESLEALKALQDRGVVAISNRLFHQTTASSDSTPHGAD